MIDSGEIGPVTAGEDGAARATVATRAGPLPRREPAVAPKRRFFGWRAFGRVIARDDLRADGNVFTLARWLLAIAVIRTHAYGLTAVDTDPLRPFLPYPVARLAVLLFFSLSGFVVTASLQRRGAVSFVTARALRILPGLWVMLAVTTVVLGLFFTSVAPEDFFTWSNLGDYVGHNMVLMGKGDFKLLGVFSFNHEDYANGPLWSIPVEVRCYLLLAVTGVIGLLGYRRVYLVGCIALLAVAFSPIGAQVLFVPMSVAFNTGVVMYLWRDRLYLSWPLAIVVVAAALAVPDVQAAQIAVQIAFAYALVVAAILLPAGVKRIGSRAPDYSYGLYIYSYPVQQALIALGIGLTPAGNLAASLAVIVPLAALSWHLVEKPAIGLKDRFARPRPPLTPEPAI